MSDRNETHRSRWVLLAALLAGFLLAQPAQAGKLDDLDTSLKWVPENAAFYGSMLRNREQVDAIAKSNAWTKLKNLPLVQMGLMMYRMQASDPDSPAGKFEAALNNPDIRAVLDLLGDMTSHEVFLYGDESFVGFVRLLQKINNAVSYGPAVMQLSGEAHESDASMLQAKAALAVLASDLEAIRAPDLVIGFKLTNKEQAAQQIDKLEAIAKENLETNPQFQGRLKRDKIAGQEFLTLTLDGKMIPWDELPVEKLKEAEVNEGDAQKVVARLKEMTVVVALGVRDDYLLLSVGASTEPLARLGKGTSLASRPELKPLEKFADKRLASISYLSEAMAQGVAGNKQSFDDLLKAVNQVLPSVQLDQDAKEQIRKDAAALAEDLKRILPEPGPMMGFSFLTDQGVEGYQYTWGEHKLWDGSKPLGLLEHLGGNPVLAIVAREKHAPENYDLLAKWVKIGFGYFEKFALPQMQGQEREKAKKLIELLRPLAQRADEVNRKMLVPALADGQSAFVLDAKLTSKQYLENLPATEQPMPMVEPAIVLGVADAQLLRKAGAEYKAILDGLVEAIRQIEPDAIPAGYKIPDPKPSKTEAGMIYSYWLPAQWGVDKKIAPNMGLSDNVFALSISRNHTRRLLTPTPLKVGGVLAKTDRPLASAGFFNWAGFVDALTPWINLAVDQIPGAGDDDATGVKAQVGTVLEVLKVIRTVTSESYLEDKAMVSHTLMEVRDVAE